jgi:hypothetical protein
MHTDKLIDSSKRLIREYPSIKSFVFDRYKDIRQIPIMGDIIFDIRWRNELSLLNGGDPSDSEHGSIIHFTLNRSASQFIKRVLSIAVEGKKILHVDWSKMAGHSKYPYLDHLEVEEFQEYRHFFKPNGYLYSHFGGFVKEIEEINTYKVLLIIRDPRDLLVSNYYSTLNSHILPVGSRKRKNLKEKRKEAKNMDIDEWVTKNSNYYKKRYRKYRTELLREHPNVHVDKFERMISNFDGFICDIFDYCNLDVNKKKKEYIEEVMHKNNPDKENINSRNRSGTPGDYKDKLKKGTIRYLDDEFAREIEYFGYEK